MAVRTRRGGEYRPRSASQSRAAFIRRGRSSSELPLRTASISVKPDRRFRFCESGDLRRAARAPRRDQRPRQDRRAARLGPAGDDAAARRPRPRRAARDARPDRAREVHRSPRSAGCSTSSRDWGEQHEYDSFEASLIRVTARDWEKARKVPADLRAEMSRVRGAREPGLGRGAQEQRLRDVPAGAAQEPRPAQALHRVLRRRATSRTTSCSTTTSAA